MKKLSILSCLLLGIAVTSCKQTDLQKADWLIGTWGHTSRDGTLLEIWDKANDTLYKAKSYFIIETDTVFAENVDLGESNGKLTYTVSVKGEKPVPFVMTSIDDKTMVFENPEHDFPSKITYTKVNNDSLVAVISGKENGKAASQTFAMSRQNK